MKYCKKPLYIAIIFILSAATSVFAQTATFSGRVTDQSTGQGIADVAVVAQGNLTGTRVSVTDSQGNYSISMGANTNISLRAYRPSFVFNPAQVIYINSSFPLTGSNSRDFTGTALPFPILIFARLPLS